jgi:hypothetical protein
MEATDAVIEAHGQIKQVESDVLEIKRVLSNELTDALTTIPIFKEIDRSHSQPTHKNLYRQLSNVLVKRRSITNVTPVKVIRAEVDSLKAQVCGLRIEVDAIQRRPKFKQGPKKTQSQLSFVAEE